MKKCLPCAGRLVEAEAATCPGCGEASWDHRAAELAAKLEGLVDPFEDDDPRRELVGRSDVLLDAGMPADHPLYLLEAAVDELRPEEQVALRTCATVKEFETAASILEPAEVGAKLVALARALRDHREPEYGVVDVVELPAPEPSHEPPPAPAPVEVTGEPVETEPAKKRARGKSK